MKALLPPVLMLALLACVAPQAQGALFAVAQVEPREADFNDNFQMDLGSIIKDAQNVIVADADFTQTFHNSSLNGYSHVLCDPGAGKIYVSTAISIDTSTDSEPPAGMESRLDTIYQMSTVANFRDNLTITSPTPRDNVKVTLAFALLGGPIQTAGGTQSAIGSITGDLALVVDGDTVLSRSGSSQNGAGDIGQFDGGSHIYDMDFVIPHVDENGVVVKISVSLSLGGYVTKYRACQADGDYYAAGVARGLVYQTALIYDSQGGELKDISILGQSGYNYANSDGGAQILTAKGTYRGSVVLLGPGVAGDGITEANLVPPKKKGGQSRVSLNLAVDGSTFPVQGGLTKVGSVKFGASQDTSVRLKRKDKPDLILMAELKKNGTIYTIEGTVAEDGTSRAWTFVLKHNIYTAAKDPVAPFINVPPDLLGKYTVLIMPDDPSGPQGIGWGVLQVKKSGKITFAGKLADGTAVSYGAPLVEGVEWPFAAKLYKKKGLFNGNIVFRETAGTSDFDALDSRWTRPAIPGPRYPNGWPMGIKLDVIGSKYVVPDKNSGQPILPGLGPVDTTNGNALFLASGGNLADTDSGDGDPATPLSKLVNVNPKNQVSVVSKSADKLAATLTPKSGALAGSFIHNATSKKTKFSGVVFQKQQTSSGYFLGPSESGAVRLDSGH